ncbi:PspC domain-containing protein [Flavobacterium zepuense]|uniref:PspC domain-containing protein n=1 Tax=Flavobacterium zepuense TaxID=2593302 RepID=A0A552UYG6_9FLAO|nr:PspC domain-containing protein [Flavobacterium zepuense]TRW23241.1 PspC domain-containing protein [Flavobacterium zepuense]
MNKTVSINLGGFFFHIDEDAYQKLNRYFDAIRRSLSPDGRDEIMSDIEGRIAELLTEKLKNDKQVVSITEVDQVIAVMGQPEDYRIDEDDKSTGSAYKVPNFVFPRTKKFYRDGDKAIIGGVCAGLGHYFRIDPLWVRILFIISPFVTFGTSAFVYILLWILIPKAITTTEKLEMTGEPINISNIEKKVKEEFSQIADKFGNVDYDKLGNNVKNGAERIGTGVSTAILAILKAVAKVIGALITIFSAIGLGCLLVGLIALLTSSSIAGESWYPYVNSMNYTETPMWVIGIAGFFAIAIPLFSLFLLGLKILSDNLRSVGNLTKYTLVVLWIVSVSACIYLGIMQSAQLANEGKTVVKEQIYLAKNDTLQVKFRYNDYFAKSVSHDYDFRFKQDSLGNEVIYNNDIELFILKTDEAQPYVQVERIASGSTMQQARKSAESIKYSFKIEGNNLILDNYLLTGTDAKFRRQRVEVFLYLPEGVYFHPDKSLQDYDRSDDEFFDLWFDGDHRYQMGKDRVKCLDCVVEGVDGDFEAVEGHPMSEAEIKIQMAEQAAQMKVQAEEMKIQAEETSKNMREQAENMKKQAQQMEEDAKKME